MSEKRLRPATGRLTYFPSLFSCACIYRSLTHLLVYPRLDWGCRFSAPQIITSSIYLRRRAPRYTTHLPDRHTCAYPSVVIWLRSTGGYTWDGLGSTSLWQIQAVTPGSPGYYSPRLIGCLYNTIGLMQACMEITTNGGILYPRVVQYGS